jgi:hypothetical protein
MLISTFREFSSRWKLLSDSLTVLNGLYSVNVLNGPRIRSGGLNALNAFCVRSDLELLNLEPPQGMAGAERWNPIGMTGTGFGI